MKTLILVLSIFILFSTPSRASLIYGGYPPPGGVTYVGSGTGIAHAGGRTFTFTNFDSSFYDDLYFGLRDIWLPAMGENALSPMSFNVGDSDLLNGLLIWNSSFSVFNAQSNQNQLVSGQFAMNFSDLLDNSLSLVAATDLGLNVEQGGFLKVLDNFKVHLQFSIDGQAALSWYDSFASAPQNQLNTSVGTAFYYTEPLSSAQIPAPPLYILFLISAMLLLVRRSKVQL